MYKLFFQLTLIIALASCHTHSHSISELLYKPNEKNKNLFSENEYQLMLTTFNANSALVTKNEKDYKAWMKILDVYLLQNRVTQDHAFADQILSVTGKLLEDKKIPSEIKFQLLSYKATALLSLHQFQQGLTIATEASKIIPQNATILGAMIDANVELGNYKAAIELTDKMVGLRPDLRSYSRVSYLRELNGDIKGAIEAMGEAVKSGVPGDEQCEWSRTNLAGLYLKNNQPDYAKMHYMIALENRKQYVPAMIGLARLHLKENALSEAEKLINEALNIRKTVDLLSVQSEILAAKGDKVNAQKKYGELMHELVHHHDADHSHDHGHEHSNSGETTDEKSQYALEAAKYIIRHDSDISKALPYLNHELKIRPNNIEVNTLLKDVYNKLGKAEEALVYEAKSKITL